MNASAKNKTKPIANLPVPYAEAAEILGAAPDVREDAAKHVTKGRGGRPPGVPNKINGTLRDAILAGTILAGRTFLKGRDKGSAKMALAAYFKRQALHEPKAFLQLIGKVLPSTLTVSGDGPDGGGFEVTVKIDVVKAMHEAGE